MQLLTRFFVFAASWIVTATYAQSNAEHTAWSLMDGASGALLMEHQVHKKVNPEDMVSLMTLFTALNMIANDENRLQEDVRIRHYDAQRTQSPRRIFLSPDTPAKLEVLLHAIAVTGAEDASLAVSAHLAQTHKAFARHMQENAVEIGMKDSVFTSPIRADDQQTSAYDLALLTRKFRLKFPKYYRWLSEKEFTYAGHSQRNVNLLLWKGQDIDGAMASVNTHDIIATWTRPVAKDNIPRELIAVVIGGPSDDKTSSSALSLLRAGRVDFETIQLFKENTSISKIDVLGGNRNKLDVGSADPIYVTIDRKKLKNRGIGGVSAKLEYEAPVMAPIKKGQKIGVMKIEFDEKLISTIDVFALHEVGKGSFLSRFLDSVRMNIDQHKKSSTKR